jgi:hypothetical protein
MNNDRRQVLKLGLAGLIATLPACATRSAAGDGEDKGFGSPDGLWFDPRGVLWIQTDVSTSVQNRGPYAKLGNNQMLAADVTTGEIRRFLTGPAGCEITGVTVAPDGRSLFVNIQHPRAGERAQQSANPARHLELA